MSKKLKNAPALAAEMPYVPTAQETATVAAFTKRKNERPAAPKLKIDGIEGGKGQVAPDHPDQAIWGVLMAETFGTLNIDATDLLLSSALSVLWPNQEKEPDRRAFNSALALLHGVNPSDEIEAMLAVQMMATHLAAMECQKRAQLSGQSFEARDMNLKHAGKLSRTYTAQVEALARYRGKGQQKMIVEHVHVHAGGQAIVGNVAPHNPGGTINAEKQPYDPRPALTYEPGTTLPGTEPQGDPLPIASGKGEAPLPVTRRR